MAAYEGTDGGAGGKFRKRPRRSHTTPYDRPPTALLPSHNLNNDNYGWFSKIVDPASKLITAGAHKLLSSFQKRLLPPPPPQHPLDEKEEIQDMQPETSTPVVAFGKKEPAIGLGLNASRTSDSTVVTELEDLLKQRTFTRSEIDHLTSLLLSRAVERSGGPNKGRSELKISDLLVDAKLEKLSNPPDHETRIELTLPEAISTPAGRTKNIVSSPAEIAKAYMGSRPVRPSSSASGLQSQIPKEELHTPHDPCIEQIPPDLSLVRKPACDVGVSSNGIVTPKFRGRSAIYSMARTPYSRPHSVIAIRPGETSSNVIGSSYHNGTENIQSERQVLKRRSSILESDIGSVGPIRRIRQKPNLLHPKILSLPPSGGGLATNGPGKQSQVVVPASMDWKSQNHSSSLISGPSSSSGYVPSQTIETAQKIFEQLDKFTSNGKSPETKSDVVVGSTPTMLRPGVLDGFTHEDTRTVGSMKALQSSPDSKSIYGSLGSVSVPSQLLKLSSRGEDGSVKAHQNGECRNISSHATNKSKADLQADYMMPEPGGEPPQRKQAFQISALEDCPELDDDLPAYGVFSSTPLSIGKEHDALPKSFAISGVFPLDLSGLKEPESRGNCSATVATTGFTPSLLPSSSPNTKTTTQEVGAQKEANNTTSMFSFKSDRLSPFSVLASATPVVSAAQDTKLETSSSTNDTAAASDGPDKIDSKSTQGFGDTLFKAGNFSSVNSSPEGSLSTGLQTNSTAPSNRFQTNSTICATDQSSAHTSLSSPLFLGGAKLTNGSAGPIQTSGADAGTSMFTTVQCSITALPASTNGLSSTTPGTFCFGGSKFPSTSTASAGTTDTSSTKSNDAGFGSSSGTLGVNASAYASGGNNISAFSASVVDSPGVNAKPIGTASIGVTFGFPTSGPSVLELASTSSLTVSSVSPPTSTSSPSFLSDSTSSFLKNGSGANVSAGFSSSVLGTTTQFSSFSSLSSALGSSSAVSSFPTSSVSSGVFGWNSSAPASTVSTPVPTSASTGFSFVLGSFGSSAATNNSPIFGALPTSSTSSNNQTFVFGTSQGSAASAFSTLVPAVSTPMSSTLFQSSPFANASTQTLAFSSTPSTNSGQMTMEDSMAEDSVKPSNPEVSPFGTRVSAPAMPAFGAPASAPSSGFSFTSSTPAAANPFTSTPAAANPFTSTPAAANPFTSSTPNTGNPFTTSSPAAGNPFTSSTPAAGSSFQFNGQLNPFTPSNRTSGSLEFNGGGANSFSLGTNDGDKSGRKYIKAKRRGAGRR